MFLRMGLVCLLLMGMALFTASARAEGDKPPKLSKAEKAYIQRMIEYGKEEKQYPDRNWMLQGCRLNMHGTWYPYDRFSVSWLGRMVLTGDSIIFENVGEFPYEVLISEYGPEVPPGGALPGRERHLFKLERSLTFHFWKKKHFVYAVIAHPPWSTVRKKPENWTFRCVPDFALCQSLESAKALFVDRDGFDEIVSDCQGFNFMPYTDD
jgi:hypothetical protein